MNDYEQHDGLGLAALVRQGHVSPSELLDAALARIERRNPQLNAVVTPMFDAARQAIAQGLPDGAFRGVPFLVKELVASVVGDRPNSGELVLPTITSPARRSRATISLSAAGIWWA